MVKGWELKKVMPTVCHTVMVASCKDCALQPPRFQISRMTMPHCSQVVLQQAPTISSMMTMQPIPFTVKACDPHDTDAAHSLRIITLVP